MIRARRLSVLLMLAFPAALAAAAPWSQTKGKPIRTSSGPSYYELKKGSGAVAKAGDSVKVNYTGWLPNGTKFDSSAGQDPIEFKLGAGHVIKGWDQGIAGMRVGGKRQLHIPAALGYGERGFGRTIPPNSELIFDVELVDAGH